MLLNAFSRNARIFPTV